MSLVKGSKHKYRSTPRIRERWNSALLRWEAWMTTRYMPLPTCVTMSNLVVLWQRVWALIEGNSQNWGAGGGLTVGAWLTPKFSPHTCYRVTFGSAASKGVCINRREPPKFGSVVASLPGGRGVHGWPLEIRPSLTCYPAEFGRSRSNDTSVIKEILLKFWPLASRLSRSVKVIRTDMGRSATYGFILTFHSNQGPYRFRDGDFSRKSQIFRGSLGFG